MLQRSPTLLLVGIGGLGGVILEVAARASFIGRIVCADLDDVRGTARANLARVGAIAHGNDPRIEFIRLDLNDTAHVADTVARLRPDVILSTASLQTWWLLDLLPEEAARPIRRARFGAWLPVHLALTLKLMRALRQAAYGGPVLTAPFPDVVNVGLARLGLAPTCGIGNVDEIVPKVRHLAAVRLGAPLESIRVFLVAHHALEAFAFSEQGSAERPGDAPPHYLRIERDGEDVTRTVDAESLLLSPYPLPGGPAWHSLTAATTIRLLHALLSDVPQLVHAPAPHGLPGGYPVVAGRGSVEVAAIPGLTLADAISLNERSHRFDGVERIESDGTVVFPEESVAAMQESLGYDCDRLAPDDADSRARELMARFREYAHRHGVDIERWSRGL